MPANPNATTNTDAAAAAAAAAADEGDDELSDLDEAAATDAHRAMGDGGDGGGAGDEGDPSSAADADHDFEARLANSPLIRELMQRLSAFEDRLPGATGTNDQTATTGGDMGGTGNQVNRSKGTAAGAKRANAPRDTIALRVAGLEREAATSRWRNKLDALRSRGTAVSTEQETEIIAATLARHGDANRQKTFDTLTKALPRAPLTDDGAGDASQATRVKDSPADKLRSVLAKLPEATRARVTANRAKLEAEAKEVGVTLDVYLANASNLL